MGIPKEILDELLSQEMEQMTPEERLRYIRDRAASTALGKKIAEEEGHAAQQADAAAGPSAGR